MRKPTYSPNTVFCYACKTIYKVQKFNNPTCNIPSSEFFRILVLPLTHNTKLPSQQVLRERGLFTQGKMARA
jgi:hypothetical protein